MQLVRSVLVATIFAMLGSAVANAEEQRVVAAGKRTAIGSFTFYSEESCASAGIPEAKVTTQAQNGRVEVVSQSLRVNAGNCGAIQVPGQVIYYTPKAGFRGPDSAAVDFFYNYFIDAPRPTSRRLSYSITVK